jgi:RNA polymerase sigma factor (sigma-70 family)
MTGPEREALILENLTLVHWVLRRLHTVPTVFEDYEDLVQNGIVGLIEAVDTYNPAAGKLSTWAVICIRRSILDHWRKVWDTRTGPMPPTPLSLQVPYGEESILEEILVDETTDAVDGRLLHDDAKAEVLSALVVLNPMDRVVAQEHYFDHATIATLARMHGVSEPRIVQRLARIKRRLRQRLEPYWYGEPSGPRLGDHGRE